MVFLGGKHHFFFPFFSLQQYSFTVASPTLTNVGESLLSFPFSPPFNSVKYSKGNDTAFIILIPHTGPAPYAILEAIEPAPTAELAHQHDTLQDLQTLALCDGYIRSRQYRLCSPQRDDWNAKWEREGKWPEKCLTVHEFESTKQGQVDEVKRAREASGGAGALHVSVYRLTGAFGNAEWVG